LLAGKKTFNNFVTKVKARLAQVDGCVIIEIIIRYTVVDGGCAVEL
jgi:hypothetical protein